MYGKMSLQIIQPPEAFLASFTDQVEVVGFKSSSWFFKIFLQTFLGFLQCFFHRLQGFIDESSLHCFHPLLLQTEPSQDLHYESPQSNKVPETALYVENDVISKIPQQHMCSQSICLSLQPFVKLNSFKKTELCFELGPLEMFEVSNLYRQSPPELLKVTFICSLPTQTVSTCVIHIHMTVQILYVFK